jgi:TatD DNase family protein
MRFVDAHIHLSDEEYTKNIDDIIKEARQANVVGMVSNSMDLETSKRSLKLSEQYSGVVFGALGIHPWNVKGLTEEELEQTVELICENHKKKRIIALGEVGLDFKYMDIWDKQVQVFDRMLRLAEELNLPVIIHSRGTTAKIVEMLPSYSIRKVLLHWFSNPISILPKVVENGYYITEGPPTAYSNGIREVVKKIPLTHLLTETDGPVRFFKQPFAGKMTTPAFIPTVVNAIADIKKTDPTVIAEQIVKNFEEFFGAKLM